MKANENGVFSRRSYNSNAWTVPELRDLPPFNWDSSTWEDSELNFKMDPELKRQWLEALRSGKHKQGTGTLSFELNDETFDCCLGVYCRVRGARITGRFQEHPGSRIELYFGSERASAYLPKELNVELPTTLQALFMGLNDGGYTFEQIARVVEVLV